MHGAAAIWAKHLVIALVDLNDNASECQTNEPGAGQKPTDIHRWSRFAYQTRHAKHEHTQARLIPFSTATGAIIDCPKSRQSHRLRSP